jgi:signal transduction histidine kinase
LILESKHHSAHASGSGAQHEPTGWSLRAKFRLLLAVLALSVVAMVAAAGWAGLIVDQDVREPLRQLTGLLSQLGDAESALRRRDLAAARQAGQALVETAFSREHLGRAGLLNFGDRLAAVPAIDTDPSPEVDQSVTTALELIHRLQARVLEDMKAAASFGSEVRRRIVSVLVVSLAAVALLMMLAISLFRRWVLEPIDALRRATSAFASGDLSYQLTIPGRQHRDELLQLSREFNAMAAANQSLQAQNIDRERLAAIGEMVRRLAHNLRNPLAGIRGLAELTRADLRDPRATDRHRTELVENQSRILATVDRFERWLSDLLNVTRPTRVEPEAVAVRAWLTGIAELHRASATARNVVLELDQSAGPGVVHIDPRHMEHALSALIGNAIEAATPPGSGVEHRSPLTPGRVRIVSVASENPPHWSVFIQDSGPGVPREIAPKLFTAYFTTKRDGNGIGLAAAMQVARAHRGTIELLEPVLDLDKADHDRPPDELPVRVPGEVDENRGQSRLRAAPAWSSGACFVVRIPLRQADAASDLVTELATLGQTGDQIGQNSRH